MRDSLYAQKDDTLPKTISFHAVPAVVGDTLGWMLWVAIPSDSRNAAGSAHCGFCLDTHTGPDSP
jgi:hypothetical protein